MCDICDDLENQSVIDAVKEKVATVCAKHPVYSF
jgi:glycine hydroxymethyltransferase